jgi:diguanylate cyclase
LGQTPPETAGSTSSAPINVGSVPVSDLARKALAKIETLHLEPTPQIYELWFRYFQGDPEIVRAIDMHAGPLDEAACHKFYKRFLSESARGDAIKTISDRIQQAINELAGTLNSVQSMTTEYGDNLVDVADKIKGASTLEDLGAVVSAIVEDTKMMVQKNQNLEFQLSNSSTQVAELKKNLDVVKKEALTDGLTGLANRKAFDKQVRDWVEEASASGTDLCILMMDIDHFKKFNDNYGHQTGDQVLRLVARTLTDGIKGRDFASRFGGEEFALLFPDTPLNAALRVADSLRHAVEGKEVVNKNTNLSLGRITLSGGLAHYKVGESVTAFIERADAALYEAKKAGRNNVQPAKE